MESPFTDVAGWNQQSRYPVPSKPGDRLAPGFPSRYPISESVFGALSYESLLPSLVAAFAATPFSGAPNNAKLTGPGVDVDERSERATLFRLRFSVLLSGNLTLVTIHHS